MQQAELDALADAVADAVVERMNNRPPQRFLTVADAAAYSGLSEDSVRNLLAAGKLTALRPVAGRIVIDRRQLDALILASTKRPARGRGVRA